MQLYVIKGRYRERIVTLGFGLMKRRRRHSYVLLFKVLAARHLALTGRALVPRLVVTDFEVKVPVKTKLKISLTYKIKFLTHFCKCKSRTMSPKINEHEQINNISFRKQPLAPSSKFLEQLGRLSKAAIFISTRRFGGRSVP